MTEALLAEVVKIVENQKTIMEILKAHGESMSQLGKIVIEGQKNLIEQVETDAALFAAIRTTRIEIATLARACGFSVALVGEDAKSA